MAIVLGTLIGMAGLSPASAASTAVVNLQDVTAIQSSSINMSAVDVSGKTMVINVTTTWQRYSSTKATLRSLVLRPVSLPRGDCLWITVGSTGEIGYYPSGRELCPTGMLAYTVNKTSYGQVGNRTNLGQLTLTIVDPANPLGSAAKLIVIEYHS